LFSYLHQDKAAGKNHSTTQVQQLLVDNPTSEK
jgi:hypothetical protein